MKKYMLSFAPSLGSRMQVSEALKSIPEVKAWRSDMPNSFYILSALPAKDLMSKIRLARGGKGRGIVLEMTNYNGWLPQETWDFLRNSPSAKNEK